MLAVPLFHCFGQNALLNSAFNVGATLVLQRKFDLNESKQLIAEEQVTQLYGVPMMFQLFHDSCQPADLSSVNYCFSAAATLPIQTSHRWQEKFGMPIHEGYGLTETSPFASYNHRLKFVPGFDWNADRLCGNEDRRYRNRARLSAGRAGEIAIRGPNVMLGYWNRPDDTAQRFAMAGFIPATLAAGRKWIFLHRRSSQRHDRRRWAESLSGRGRTSSAGSSCRLTSRRGWVSR